MAWGKKAVVALADKVVGVIGEVVGDKDLAKQLSAKIESEIIAAGTSIVLAEASGGWLQRNWRPMMMVVFIYIILNNFILAPYAKAFFGFEVPVLPIPGGMWGMLTAGTAGYVGGRSFEKVAKINRGKL